MAGGVDTIGLGSLGNRAVISGQTKSAFFQFFDLACFAYYLDIKVVLEIVEPVVCGKEA